MPSASTGRGFHGGDSTVSRTTSGMSSRRNPSDSRLEGAPIARAKIEDAGRGVGDTERGGHPDHRVGSGLLVVADGVRQHDRVDVAVCQTERPAEHVADPVVHRHAHDPERRAGEVRAVERLAARVEVGGSLHRRRDPASERADPFHPTSAT